MSDERIDILRQRVAETDGRIVEAVNERLRLVAEIWALKDELGLPVVDEARESRLRALLAERNPGPLSEHGLDDLVAALLELTKRELGAGPSG